MRDGIDPAAFVAAAMTPKPQLVVRTSNLPATVCALSEVLAASGELFERGGPVKVLGTTVVQLTKHGVVMQAHRLCEPVKLSADGKTTPVTLPERVAQMWLDSHDWKLPPLVGISTAPLLSSDGTVRTAEGYDASSGLWCANPLSFEMPSHPTMDDANDALDTIRAEFATFPFADAIRQRKGGLELVDLNCPPEQDESAFLLAFVTAVCRPSLWLAPGFLINAPAISGAGSGKGLLVRAINIIAFGLQPRAVTIGSEKNELDKRLAAELMEAQPCLFLDNVNGTALHSDLLASVLTERPTRVRVLGRTQMAPLNSTAFVAVTGNGLTVKEDLARRFIHCELDAHCENPESRPFPSGFLHRIAACRIELLRAVLTIWRWGRQNASDLYRGKPLGSFEKWGEWCRDPLFTLGCRDPVERVEVLKSNDPRRQQTAELFRAWWQHHGSTPMAVNDLGQAVKNIVDPQNRGRQYQAVAIGRLAGTRAAGFALSRQPPAGRWTAATYALIQEAGTDGFAHRTDRAHKPNGSCPEPVGSPISPMGPMPYEIPR